MFVMVVVVKKDEQNVLRESEVEAEIESTTLVDSLQVAGAAINEPFNPTLVIKAPVICKPGEKKDKDEKCRQYL